MCFAGELNCMVELENGHQFKCKVMKNLMKEIRDRGLLEENPKIVEYKSH